MSVMHGLRISKGWRHPSFWNGRSAWVQAEVQCYDGEGAWGTQLRIHKMEAL